MSVESGATGTVRTLPVFMRIGAGEEYRIGSVAFVDDPTVPAQRGKPPAPTVAALLRAAADEMERLDGTVS